MTDAVTAHADRPTGLSLVTCVHDLALILGNVQQVVKRLQVIAESLDSGRQDVPQDTSSTHPSVSEPHSDSETEVIHDCPCAPLLPTNLVEKKDMYYAVIVGRHPGVFHGPANVTSNTNRIPGGNATRWHTREEALNAFYSALDDGLVERVSHTVVRTVLDRNDHFEIPSS